MTIRQLIDSAKKELGEISQTPTLDVEILLAKAMDTNREHLIAHKNDEVDNVYIQKFQELLGRRKNYEPIAQIIGKKEFFGLDFCVNKDVLTPRPETEILVEEIIKFLEEKDVATVIDVGTGSGCIAVSLSKYLPKEIKVYAIDISEKALKMAKHNAETHKVKINFIKSDLLKNLTIKPGKNMVFAANLPYIATSDNVSKEVMEYEPHIALFGGDNGMELFEKLFKQIEEKYPNFAMIIFECDPRQQEYFEDLRKKHFSKRNLVFYEDLSGKIRGGKII